jgi:hypothetical protein
MRIYLEQLDLILLDDEHITQEERELIIETLYRYKKERKITEVKI